MKNVIITMSILSAAIIAAVLLLSYAKENQYKNITSDEYSNYYADPEPEFDLYIVTTTMKFWDRVAALNSTPGPDAVTDEDGNTVTDEDGNPVTEPAEQEDAPVSDVPSDDSDDNITTIVPDNSEETDGINIITLK